MDEGSAHVDGKPVGLAMAHRLLGALLLLLTCSDHPPLAQMRPRTTRGAAPWPTCCSC